MPKKNDNWLSIRADEKLKERLKRWMQKFRRANRSDAARIILEDRLEADGIK